MHHRFYHRAVFSSDGSPHFPLSSVSLRAEMFKNMSQIFRGYRRRVCAHRLTYREKHRCQETKLFFFTFRACPQIPTFSWTYDFSSRRTMWHKLCQSANHREVVSEKDNTTTSQCHHLQTKHVTNYSPIKLSVLLKS